MSRLNPNLTMEQLLAWSSALDQAGLLNQRPGSRPVVQSNAYNPGGRGVPQPSLYDATAAQFSEQYGVDPIVAGDSGKGSWGMFLTQLLPTFLGLAAGSGALGQIFGGGGSIGGIIPDGFAASIPTGGAAAAPALAPGVTVTAPLLSTPGALGGAGAGLAVSGAAGQPSSGMPQADGVTVTGMPSPLSQSPFAGISSGALGGALGDALSAGEMAPNLGEPTQISEPSGVNGGKDVLGRILRGALSYGSPSRGMGSSGAPSTGAPSTGGASPSVMASASPFGGGGAGAGSPAGVAIKGSAAPDIYPWTTPNG